MNKNFFTGIISLVIGYVVTLGSIVLFIFVFWNLVVPRIGGPRIGIIDVILLYALFRLFNYDWMKTFNSYIKSVKRKPDQL